ncbi:MAG TPA: FMN-binding protein [Burkholderiales bacterium]|nr:FMN-binding protein [Burkholderiales bacterium]
MRWALAAACVLAPASAHAIDYMTADQAAKSVFPDADRFESVEIKLDSTQMQELASRGVQARTVAWPVRVARAGDATLGYVVVDAVIGKFELISYAVGIRVDGSVTQIEILSYRESHGFEIRNAAWRRQFAGKTAASALRVGEDIANISGATLSCEHVTLGVKRIVNIVDLAKKAGALG